MIKMKAGCFGLPYKGTVKKMDKNSPPFEASAEQEARLVRLGLAVYVNTPAPVGFDETQHEGGDETDEIVSLEEMSANDLRALGKEYGLSFKVGTKKADMIEAIKEAQGGESDGDTTEDGDGEEAPAFDPSEAVQ